MLTDIFSFMQFWNLFTTSNVATTSIDADTTSAAQKTGYVTWI